MLFGANCIVSNRYMCLYFKTKDASENYCLGDIKKILVATGVFLCRTGDTLYNPSPIMKSSLTLNQT